MSGRVDSLSHSHDTRHHNTSHCCASTTIATYSLRHMFMQPGPTLILRLYTMCFYLCHWLLFGNLNTVRPPKKHYLGHFDTDFDAVFPLTLFHGAAGAKTCIRCALKKPQSRSDYFEGAKRHNIVSTQKKTVAKRLFAGAKRLLRAEGSCCWRRRRLVQGAL